MEGLYVFAQPAFRIMDLTTKQESYVDLLALGITEEPEMIDFCGDNCYYSDAPGNLYTVAWT